MVRHSAEFHGEIRNRLQLLFVPVHDRRMNLKRQPRRAAILHAFDSARPAAWIAAERIVLRGRHRVERNAHTHRACRLQVACHLRRDQRAVCAEDRAQAKLRRVFYKFQNVGARQRLAARKNHDLEARTRDLIEELLCFRRRKLLLRLAARIAVAVLAVHVAGIRRVPRDDHIAASSRASPISSSVR